MIKETYCSYEVSKLLKKNGFDGNGEDSECHMFYCEYTEERIMPICEIGLVPDNEEVFFAPTHQMAIAWLREKGILLWVYPAICLNAEDNRTFHCGTARNKGMMHDILATNVVITPMRKPKKQH